MAFDTASILRVAGAMLITVVAEPSYLRKLGCLHAPMGEGRTGIVVSAVILCIVFSLVGGLYVDSVYSFTTTGQILSAAPLSGGDNLTIVTPKGMTWEWVACFSYGVGQTVQVHHDWFTNQIAISPALKGCTEIAQSGKKL